jgi:hypothetical protein
VDDKRPCSKFESAEGEAERPTAELLKNQSVEMAKEAVPPVDLKSDEREARNQKATKMDDAKVSICGTTDLQISWRNNLDANWTPTSGNDS